MTLSTPPENPEKSKREWEAFFARWPGGKVGAEPEEKADLMVGKQKLTMEDF